MRRLTTPQLILIATFSAAGLGRSPAADPDVESRVRAAIAASAQPTSAPGVAAEVRAAIAASGRPEGCGVCLPEAEARVEARRVGKSMVLFVAGCSGRATTIIADTGAIPGKADSYTGDQPADPKTPRIVVMTPGPAANDTWTINATLPPNSTPARVKEAMPEADGPTSRLPVPPPVFNPIIVTPAPPRSMPARRIDWAVMTPPAITPLSAPPVCRT